MMNLDDILTLERLPLENRRLFVRVDFNVPLNESGNVTSDERIRGALRTVNYAVESGAKVILASHLGRPKGKPNSKYSLAPVAKRLEELLGTSVRVASDCVGEAARREVDALRMGEICLLENLRFHAEEEANDRAFAAALAELCDVYVNDAFGSSHRAHASVDALPRRMSERCMGFLLRDEVRALSKILGKPERPFVAVLGGAKVADKIGVIRVLIESCDTICIGGAMANTLLAARGANMQGSRIEADWLARARTLLDEARSRGVDVLLPTDVVVAENPDTHGKAVCAERVPSAHAALDIGPETVAAFSQRIAGARTVFWNGPMGLFEKADFSGGTHAVAVALAESPAFTVVGGGDSVAAVQSAGASLAGRINFISTGGGAALELLEQGTLPGIEALR